MSVPLIPCRNPVTGAEAEIPETALQHMPDWQPIGGADPTDPADQTALTGPPTTPADPSDQALADPAPDPADDTADQPPAKPAVRTTTRSKAATASKEGK